MKTALKHRTIAALTIAALTWPSLKLDATEVEEEFEATEEIGAREAYRRMQLEDENGEIPADAWTNAYAEKDTMRFLPEAWSEFTSAAQSEAGIQGGVWVSIGPGNIGGRIRSILIHPQNPDTMWVGGVSGGVWKSTNGGLTWSTNTDRMENLAVTCMAMDSTGPNITIYAGTGGDFNYQDIVRGDGIFKSTDGGSHWTPLASTANNVNFQNVYRLAVCPTNPQLLLAATGFGIFRSTDGGDQWTKSTGYGNHLNWLDVRFRPVNGLPEVEQVDPADCLASNAGGQVYYSHDNGATWETNTQNGLPSSSLPRIELAYSRSDPWIVYASTSAVGSAPSELFYSDDGGHSFASLGHPEDPANPSLRGAVSYTNVLWVDPTDPDTVVVGGVSLLRTRDRGDHWEEAGTGSHLDVHMILEHPDYDGTPEKAIAFSASDGGIHRTGNILLTTIPRPEGGSVRWASRNNTLGVTQFYGAAGHVATGKVIGGTQDNGTVRFQPSGGPEYWGTMAAGDGGFCAVDQTTDPHFYGETLALQIYRSTNGGGKAHYIWGGPGHPSGIPMACGGNPPTTPCANFTAPFVIDPNLDQENEQKTILAGGRSLWRTVDARVPNATQVAWTEIKQPITGNENINAIAVAEGFPDLIWVGYNNGSVSFTTDGTIAVPSWSPGDPNNLLPGGQPLDRRLCTASRLDKLPSRTIRRL